MKIAIRNKKIGFIGAGNMTRSLASSFVRKNIVETSNIYVSNRTPGKLEKIKNDLGVNTVSTNEDIVNTCDIIFLSIKPKDIAEALDEINRSFTSDQTLISIAAGVSISQIKKHVHDIENIIRVMPNTPVSIGEGVIGYCSYKENDQVDLLMDELFSEISNVVKVSEGEMFSSLMVASSSGIGFVYELMLYWQEWLEEYGFDADEAKQITLKTFTGAVRLAENNKEISLQQLQNNVATKKGVTAAGLDSMRELEIERALRYSFEKAILRDKDISKNFNEM